MKCMVLTNKQNLNFPSFFLSSQPLEYVQKYYLGVIVTTNLSWSQHIQTIVAKQEVC